MNTFLRDELLNSDISTSFESFFFLLLSESWKEFKKKLWKDMLEEFVFTL